MKYPARLEPTEDGFVITFRDIPEAITQGSTYQEALEMAADALLTSMDFYFEDKRIVPPPSDMELDEVYIELPVTAWIKVLLLNTMIEQYVTQIKLSKLLKTSSQQVTRIVSLKYPTKINTLQKALKVLGKDLIVTTT